MPGSVLLAYDLNICVSNEELASPCSQVQFNADGPARHAKADLDGFTHWV